MNTFGGDWTNIKIEVLIEYAKAYLTIMNNYPQHRTLYFDGFAGTGFIVRGDEEDLSITIGAAKRIVEIDEPTSFDGYYFVEKDSNKLEELKQNTSNIFPQKRMFFVDEDCNQKLRDMADHLKSSREKRGFDKVLAYIDPCGMQLEWDSLEALEGIGADVWILVPTGMGVNRLLVSDGKINSSWVRRLEVFLGLSEKEIKDFFYKDETKLTLFGKETKVEKKTRAIERAANLYRDRLSQIFTHVTDPLALKNDKNSIMYHYIFASNNRAASNIATDIIKKYSY